MDILVLGGTQFVGRAVVDEALRRGWRVTVFHRGAHPAPTGAAVLIGNRGGDGGGDRGDDGDGDLRALAHGRWDAVVDTWAGPPAAVAATARQLYGRVGTYAYVSSRSVYVQPAPPGADETAPVVAGWTGESLGDAGADYAAVKRGGELAALEVYGDDAALLIRAGLILGPWENVGRLPWWLNRIAAGGDVLAPGPRELAVQYVDVRDLARWTADALVARLGGPYNLVSAPGQTTMGGLLEACARFTGSNARLRWAGPEVIEAAGIEPWTQLPVWLPPGPTYDSLHHGDVRKALGTGLRCRPVAETVRYTWRWLRGLDGVVPPPADRPAVGLDPEVEARVLARLTQ